MSLIYTSWHCLAWCTILRQKLMSDCLCFWIGSGSVRVCQCVMRVCENKFSTHSGREQTWDAVTAEGKRHTAGISCILYIVVWPCTVHTRSLWPIKSDSRRRLSSVCGCACEGVCWRRARPWRHHSSEFSMNWNFKFRRNLPRDVPWQLKINDVRARSLSREWQPMRKHIALACVHSQSR